MLERIEQIHDAAVAEIAAADTAAALEELRVKHLGRKAELPNLLRGVAQLEPSERGAVGKRANEVRRELEGLIEARTAALESTELDARLLTDTVDVTLPGDPPRPVGRHHLISATQREIEDVFLGLGFSIVEGPQVETVFYNFDALNHDPAHPARSRSDTFYVDDDTVLRTHTSPMQIRAMEQWPPPISIIVPGRVYRLDSDATHSPQFTQIEGLCVDEDITLADLKGVLLAFARAIFGDEREIRLRPHFFPFTEPSVEVDVSCFNCARDGSPCRLCKGSGWIEILGSGMVDPNVFGFVRERGYDPDKVQGFAFGMGVERIAMLKHGVPDLRLFFDNDLRFLEQFG
ncbi:MAG: phenylalanyl-tRNA synthetase alpha chain [Solirubrobacteraceae bacterium]|jgi:phenylalanyl-tRNA synthetase alpha chain|nr:phenylalanyl-tRNA synthetase alpha chain [Solirubrobacteraceae bacterium]